MTATPHLRVEKEGALAWLIFDRVEKYNAMSAEMWQAFPGVLAEAADDPDVKVIILRGVDETAFVAGADISQFAETFPKEGGAAWYFDIVHHAEDAIATCAKPVIAMIQGNCIGGGIELAIACDMRFASTESRFGIPPANLGITYSLYSTKRVVEAIGPSKARDLLYSGRLIGSEEALTWGLVDRLYAPAEIEAETRAYAELLGSKSQYSIHYAKLTVRRILEGHAEETTELRDWRLGAWDDGDLKEGVAAFLEKRKPKFGWRG